VAQATYPVLSILLVPFYIRYLGLEAYGLVGFFVLIETLLGIFSKGFGVTFQREIARRDAEVQNRRTFRRLIRTFEIVYWAMGIVAALVLMSFSGALGRNWINVSNIPMATVKATLILVALRICLVMPKILYSSSFIGTQKQTFSSMVETITILAGALGQVAVVGITRSVIGFMVVQVITAAINVLLFRYFMEKRILPPLQESDPATFDFQEVKNMSFFALNMMWANGVGIIMLQMDRFFISKFLPIAQLGVYNIGTAGGRLLNIFIGPVMIAMYPTTCQMALDNEKEKFSAHIDRNLKISVILCSTVAFPLCFFSHEILTLWIRKPDIVASGTMVLAFYTLATLALAYANVFYLVQKATGKLAYMSASNAAALLWYPVAMYFSVHRWGLLGAALANILYSVVELIVGAIVTYKVILRNTSFFRQLAFPLLMTMTAAIIMYIFKSVAVWFFPYSILGRLAFAGTGAIFIFGTLYLACFGFRVPQEFRQILTKVRGLSLSSN